MGLDSSKLSVVKLCVKYVRYESYLLFWKDPPTGTY